MFWVSFFRDGSPPLFDLVEQDGGDCTSIKVVVGDKLVEETLRALLCLESFSVSRALAAVYAAGVNAGQRAVRSRPAAG